jgi:hypothetical protein
MLAGNDNVLPFTHICSLTVSMKRNLADYLGFFLLLAAYIVLQLFMEPFHRMFSLDDLRISYPHALVERVPVCRYRPLHK